MLLLIALLTLILEFPFKVLFLFLPLLSFDFDLIVTADFASPFEVVVLFNHLEILFDVDLFIIIIKFY